MELMTHRHLHPKTPLTSFCASTLLSNTRTSALLFLQPFLHAGYGSCSLNVSRPHLFLIKALLAERPTASPPGLHTCQATLEMATEAAARLDNQDTAPRLPLKLQREEVENEMGMEDTELESMWVHRVWVAVGSSAMVGMMVKAIEAAGTAEERAGMVVAAIGAYIVADLATGVYHWGVDNYGDAKTPIFGTQIDAFQGHHRRPWTITKRKFANNIHALARPATFALAPFLLLPSHPYVDSFLAVFLACVVYSQQFHAWAHAKKKDLPVLVLAMQESGVLVSRRMHGAHHRPPYNVNYCIVSGLWNPLLDRLSFFARLEKFIFSTCNIRPRSWGETATDWLQDGSYFSDGTDGDDTTSHG